MKSSRPLWVIISPIIQPAPGGAAVYYKSLSDALTESGSDVLVITEKHPDAEPMEIVDGKQGRLTINRLFPYRAGRSQRDVTSYIAYAVLNLKMLQIASQIRNQAKNRGDASVVILIHSSFFYNPSILNNLLDRIRRSGGPKALLVADVRDPLFSEKLISIFNRFDVVIGCSKSIANKLSRLPGQQYDVEHIPIPFHPFEKPSDQLVSTTLDKHGLQPQSYVFNPNGVTNRKAYPLLLSVVRELRKLDGFQDLQLVTAGRSRDWSARDDLAVSEGVLVNLGPVSHQDIICLAKGSALTAILSKIEGLPRAALESLHVGCPVLLPPLEEFEHTVNSHVARSEEPADLAAQIAGILRDKPPQRYPIESHHMDRIIKTYKNFENRTA